MDEKVTFKSKGETIAGVLTRPDNVSGPLPLVIMAGGWGYVKELVMPHYAKYLHDIGCATLRFDYRGFGESTGSPRQHIDPWGQIEDYRNAFTFAETLEDIDLSRTGVWGISYSGGHILILSAVEPRAKFAIGTVPVVDGFQTMRRVHGETEFGRMQRAALEDRRKRQRGEPGELWLQSSLDYKNEFSHWPVPECNEVFHRIKAEEAPNHEHWTTIESFENLLMYNVFPFCERNTETPVLLTVAAGDDITSADLEAKAFNAITNPNKKFVAVEGVTHMSIYANLDHLGKMGREHAKWLRKLLTHEED